MYTPVNPSFYQIKVASEGGIVSVILFLFNLFLDIFNVIHVMKSGLFIVGEPKPRIMQKHQIFAPESYTAEFLYMECLNAG